MTLALILILIIVIVWLLALEIRFHGVKSIADDSIALANEAAADARNAINKVVAKAKK